MCEIQLGFVYMSVIQGTVKSQNIPTHRQKYMYKCQWSRKQLWIGGPKVHWTRIHPFYTPGSPLYNYSIVHTYMARLLGGPGPLPT